MSLYGYDAPFHDYGFSDTAITRSLFGHAIPPMAATIDYDDELYARRRPPPRQRPPSKTPSSPPKHRHDGTSPLPLGMDWSFAPLIWEGRNSVWGHDLHKGWSYCVTIPSLSSVPSADSSDIVFYGVKVGIQSPDGITTTRTVPRRFNEFLKLYSELRKEFPKENLPPAPPKRLVKTKSKKVLVERICALECWMTKLLSDIDISRTAPVAIFLELEAAARQACIELNQNESADMDNSGAYETSDTSAPSSEKENYDESNMENVNERGLIINSNEENINIIMDMEDLRRKCTELEFERAYAESMKESIIHDNELLIKELYDAKEQIEILRKEKEEMELKSKSDVNEVNSLRTSYLELKEAFSKCLEEKVELEKEKKRWEDGKACN
ncbi:hypothetical protein L1887_10675 [Cichorium endivia]|nr:hypothetical protein L1887_10675 [Cichorium endivia]